MRHATDFTLANGWDIPLRDAGIAAANVLKRAGLPADLFTRLSATVGVPEYYRLW